MRTIARFRVWIAVLTTCAIVGCSADSAPPAAARRDEPRDESRREHVSDDRSEDEDEPVVAARLYDPAEDDEGRAMAEPPPGDPLVDGPASPGTTSKAPPDASPPDAAIDPPARSPAVAPPRVAAPDPSGGSAPPPRIAAGATRPGGPEFPPLPTTIPNLPFPAPAGGAAPPNRPLPQTIHINPLRTIPGSRAAQPLVLESPRRTFTADPAPAPSFEVPAPEPTGAEPPPPPLPPRPATAMIPRLPAPAGPPRIPVAPPVDAPTSEPRVAAVVDEPAAAPSIDADVAEREPASPPARKKSAKKSSKKSVASAPPPETEVGAEEDASDSTATKGVASTATAPPPRPAVKDRRVRVFFGTDRRAVGDPREFYAWHIGWIPGVLAGFVAAAALVAAILQPRRRPWYVGAVILAATVSGVTLLRGPLASDMAPTEASPRGVEFTAERGRLSLGWCDVTIPPRHDPGEVESPSILRLEVRPNPEKHVVLERVVREEADPFFAMVRERVQRSPRRDLFLFVHGYNVSFEDAARRTAQISFDLDFEGAPLFFSWPSQAELVKYTVDENNVAWCVSHLKEFLLDVVRRSDAKSVNLIAHSMGNRALGAAIRELELELKQDDAIFNEVVLAAPDVDAGIFKRDIAPALRRAARHATLYASNHDQALLISKVVHGYPRAGDSGPGLVLVDGVETIDVSRIDLSLLGHSYYGSSEAILDDLGELLSESRRPAERKWLRATERNGMPYWTFREDWAGRRARESRLWK